MNDKEFIYDLNLQQLSAIATAINCWKMADVHAEITRYFSMYGGDGYYYCSPREFEYPWRGITDKVICQAESLGLPKSIESLVQIIIPYIGKKILIWARHLSIEFDLKSSLQEIYWTCNGSIDESKVFQFQLSKSNIDQELNIYELIKKNSVLTLACVFVQEDFIKEKRHKKLMKNVIKTVFCKIKNVKKNLDTHSIISIWLTYFFFQNFQTIQSKRKSFNYSDAELLKKCAKAGLKQAVYYFRRRLDNDGNDVILVECAADALQEACAKYNFHHEYINVERLEIVIYLLNEMSEETRNSFIAQNCDSLVEKFLDEIMSHHVYLIQMFDIIYRNHLFINYESVFELIINKLREYRCKNVLKEEILLFQNILEKFLGITPEERKNEYIPEFRKITKGKYSSIFEEYHFSTVLIVFKGLKEQKEQLIDSKGYQFLRGNVKKCNFNLVNEVIDVLNFKSFKSKFEDILKELLKEADFDSADKVFNWLSDSAEKRIQLKRNIDTNEILFSYCKKSNFSISNANKLLMWKFDLNSEPPKKMKAEIMSKNLVQNIICKLWCDYWSYSYYSFYSQEKSRLKCTELLEWFLEPEEIYAFKKGIVEDENFVWLYCEYLRQHEKYHYVETIDQLLEFCSISNDKIEEVKKKIIVDIDKWIEFYGIKKMDLRKIDFLVKWISKTEEQCKTIIENYMNSSGGVELFFTVVQKCFRIYNYGDDRRNCFDPNHYDHRHILHFFNHWLKPFENLKRLKENLLENSSKDYEKVLPCLLANLERSRDICFLDLRRIFRMKRFNR